MQNTQYITDYMLFKYINWILWHLNREIKHLSLM